MKTLMCALLVVAATACSGVKKGEDGAAPSGSVVTVVKALTSSVDVTRVAVAVDPAGVSQDLTRDESTGNFVGAIVGVPVGDQTVTGTAYAGAQVVGTGSTSVTVTAGGVVSAYLRILDSTGAAPTPDHGPIVTSVVASSVAPNVGASIHLAATAVDPDGDGISYAWTQDCAAGSFTAPSAAETDWSASASGQCTLTVTASARSLGDAVATRVTVFPGGESGAIDVTGVFVEWPYIESIYVSDDSYYMDGVAIYRTGPDATVRMQVQPGEMLYVQANPAYWSQLYDSISFALSDDCGGGASLSDSSSWIWTAPLVNTVCMLTVSMTADGLVDRFPVAIFLSGCADDVHEPNEAYSQVGYLSWGTSTGLYANDDDWYALPHPVPAGTTITVSLQTTAELPVEIITVASSGSPPEETVVASGTNRASFFLTEYGNPFIRVAPPALPSGTCGPPYALTLAAVHVSPWDATVGLGGTQTFLATAWGASPTFTWAVIGDGCGSIVPDGSQYATYTAPSTVPAGPCQVVASYTDAAGTYQGGASLTVQ